jgi:hypothetical protein
MSTKKKLNVTVVFILGGLYASPFAMRNESTLIKTVVCVSPVSYALLPSRNLTENIACKFFWVT